MYKLVCVDMDETLLTSERKILPETIEKIKKANDKGCIFCLATGRSYTGVKKYLDLIDLDMPLILMNGSQIAKSKTREILYNNCIKLDTVNKIIDKINKKESSFIFYANEELYVNKIDEYSSYYMSRSSLKSKVISECDHIPYDKINKIIWLSSNPNLLKYQEEELKGMDGINYFISDPTFLEIVNSTCDKGTGIDFLIDYYHLKREEVIAIGDSYNDIPMFLHAGLSIAMKNANKDIKDKCMATTTLDNNHNGVGEVINKYILN